MQRECPPILLDRPLSTAGQQSILSVQPYLFTGMLAKSLGVVLCLACTNLVSTLVGLHYSIGSTSVLLIRLAVCEVLRDHKTHYFQMGNIYNLCMFAAADLLISCNSSSSEVIFRCMNKCFRYLILNCSFKLINVLQNYTAKPAS